MKFGSFPLDKTTEHLMRRRCAFEWMWTNILKRFKRTKIQRLNETHVLLSQSDPVSAETTFNFLQTISSGAVDKWRHGLREDFFDDSFKAFVLKAWRWEQGGQKISKIMWRYFLILQSWIFQYWVTNIFVLFCVKLKSKIQKSVFEEQIQF